MNKTIKRFLATVLAATMVVGSAMTSRAAQWQQNTTGWWYQEDNGSYPVNTWKWIDGKCYYFDGNGYMLSNTTTPDGYQVDASGAWVVNGVVQTQGTNSTGNAAHSGNYDQVHPLAGMVDAWNLRLSDSSYSSKYVCSWNVQAMLTGQMDQYFAPPVGDYIDTNGNHIYTTQEAYNLERATEQALYNWFCNWLNSFDFQNMSELERAQEIKKVLETKGYDTEWENSNRQNISRDDYYAVLINNKGVCSEFASTALALAKSLGLKSTSNGSGNHVNYFIQVNGQPYIGSNQVFNLERPTTTRVYFSE